MLGSFQRSYTIAISSVLAAIMALLLTIMTVQVFSRYALNTSLIWAEEICRYLLIWVTFLACGVAYMRGEIAAIELLERALSPRPALLAAILKNILILILLGFLIHYGWRYAVFSGTQPIPALDFLLSDLFGDERQAALSIFWVYVSVPVGMALLAVHVGTQTILYCLALRKTDTGTPRADQPRVGDS